MAELINTEIETSGEESVWVLDDPRAAAASQAIGIAERLGIPFRRIPMAWNWLGRIALLSHRGSLLGLAPSGHGAGEPTWLTPTVPIEALAARGRGPALALAAGRRAAAVALWLKQRFGTKVVQCGPAGPLAARQIDLQVLPGRPDGKAGGRVFAVLGSPSRMSPLMLRQTAALWRERLEHMPRPRVALLVGAPHRAAEISPAAAHELGRRVARLAAARGGSVMAATGHGTGAEATEALAAGLSNVISLLHRAGEPGEDPRPGYLALADAIVLSADLGPEINQACAGHAGVYLTLAEMAGPRQRRLINDLLDADQVRWLDDRISPWPRQPLDEAGRVAAEIRRRFPLE
jgi:mitochondrial fission protein ELM1